LFLQIKGSRRGFIYLHGSSKLYLWNPLEFIIFRWWQHTAHCDLWVFEKFLSILANDYNNKMIKIWVMKEYKMHWVNVEYLKIKWIWKYNLYILKLITCHKEKKING
jgi:hypothetical protein